MASSVGLERGAPLAWPLAWPGACVAGVWDTDTDGFPREFVAKVIVVDPYASEPPACRGAGYVWAAKDELDAIEATVSDKHRRYLRSASDDSDEALARGRGAARTRPRGRAGPAACAGGP